MLSKEEIEKAKERLKNLHPKIYWQRPDTLTNELKPDVGLERAIETLLQYIDQLEQENKQLKIAYKLMENEAMKDGLEERKKQSKIIDEMAGYIATLDIDEDICSKTQNEHCDKMSLGECESCIKKHFTKKVEGK